MPTLVVEDGTIVANANSYTTEAFADAYFLSRNDTVWAAYTAVQKAEYLIRAADYLDNRYRLRFKGERADPDQALEWPRANVYDGSGDQVDWDEVPIRLQRGQCEAAVAIGRDGHLEVDLATPGRVKRKKVKAGPVETDTEWMGGGDPQKEYPRIVRWINDFLKPVGRITRA